MATAVGVVVAGMMLANRSVPAAHAEAPPPKSGTPAAAPASKDGARAEAPPSKEGAEDSKAARYQALEAIQAEQKQAAEAEAALRKEIQTIGEDRTKLNEDLISTAARLRAIEDRIAATETRLGPLATNEAKVRNSLDGRRAVIVEVLAALQRMRRRPPAAILVSPEDALSSVRAAIMLGAVLPGMQTEVQALARDLTELVHVRADIAAERDGLTRDLAALSLNRQRIGLLIDERQKRLAAAEQALDGEHQRAAALAHQADSLKDLIAKLEAAPAGPARGVDSTGSTKDGRSMAGSPSDPARLAPAIAFASARGALPLPVNGVKVREFGAPDGLGGTEKGLWIASRAGAQVTAPCDARVVYAGPFRSYGQLLILNAGGGYHVLLAGMDRISVDLGQFVLTGEPVAIMGNGPQSAAAVATGSSQPILYVEFRKDGAPVDPSPWWATTDSERVRG
jgi:septal ring factor EnvC (AmiA/AmiB activator)